MNCTVLSENLVSVLSILGRITTRGNLPILENVLIESQKGRIYLSTTNLEAGITTSIGGKIDQEGTITVPIRLFSEYIRLSEAGKINLTVKDQTLWVKSKNSTASFTTIPASEFPPFPKKDVKIFTLHQNDLLLLASQVAFAASQDEGRPVLTGIKLKKSEEKLIVAATDGFRLSTRSLSLRPADIEKVIPASTIAEIAKIITDYYKEPETEVEIYYTKDKNQLIFTLGDIEIFTRLIEGEFPKFERLIPTTSTTQVIVDKRAFLQAIKAAAIFARESANIVKITINKGKIIVSANTPQIGEEKTEVEATVSGEENEIAFNFRFLLDFLNSIVEEEIYFQMTNPLAPGLFRPAKDTAYTHIIMPVRVQGSD